MKRMTIAAMTAAALCAGAQSAVAAPATFSGTCSITGVSTFDPPLTGSTQTIKYDFKSGPPAEGAADATTCSGTLNGAAVENVAVKAKVAGEGALSCSHGESTAPGQGSLEFPDGSTFPFGFTFSAVATEVDFVADFGGGTTATGHASFLHYAPPTTPIDCEGDGIKALGFDATTDAPSGTATGTKPDPASQGGGGDTGGSTENTVDDQARERAAKRKACMKKAKKIKNKKKRKKAKKRCTRKYA